MARGTLNETVTVVLDGGGNGSVRVGPLTARETWWPKHASVRVNVNPTNEATCRIYVGETATQDNFRDVTFSGSSGDSSGKVEGKLSKGWYIHASWAGGDAGQVAYLIVDGEKDV